MRFYADTALEITAQLKGAIQRTFTQGEFEMAIVDMSVAEDGPGFDVEVEWVGFDRKRTPGNSAQKFG